MSRWLAALPLIVLAALGLLFGVYALNRNPQVQPRALVGKAMPAVSLASLGDGTPINLRTEASAGPVVVNFFASWCAPCQIEHPVLMGLKGRGVRIIGIDYEDVPPRGSPERAKALLDRLGNPYSRVLTDPDGRAGIEFGITGVPETYVVAPDGKILAKHTGPLTDAEAAKLARLLR